MRAIRRFTVRTVLPAPLAPLGELATNLRWSWHPQSRELFRSLDPALWQRVEEDPVALLGGFSPERLSRMAADEALVARVQDAAADLRAYQSEPRWYQGLADAPPASIAYFSPEYGITAVLPQYSGGLGILAGDHLKTASDLGVPIVGVGLLYRAGYFKQALSREGWQQETYPVLDPNGLPLSILREADGEPCRVCVGLPHGRSLVAQVWIAQVGRVPLLLLDSNVPENPGPERDTTDRLYGGGSEHRLLQEMLLGIGGVRALRAYSRITGAPEPEVFHTNEGHAGFLGLERIRELTETGLDFDAALESARAATVFTTHTPVPAGIDRFSRDLVSQHFGGDNACDGVPVDRVLGLGAETYPGGDPSVFNMAVMGMRLAQRANGVAKLHGQVSRGMFSGLWPGFDNDDVPIASVTNGVHAPTWVAPEVFELGREQAGGPSAAAHSVEDGQVGPGDGAADEPTEEAQVWASIAAVSDARIWGLRGTLRAQLVTEARRRLRSSWQHRGASDAELGWVENALDPDVLTIGFARRVPSYKRLTLMLRDPARLRRLLLDPQRPVQLIIAGKSHPADDGGKRLIQELVRFTDDPEVRHRIVFLPNYDIAMASHLYPGCDVWLNNPLRPLEACGTSGMKAALNGCLNLSILDGWWDEMYDGQNGWAIPTADGVEDPDRRDELEANALYDLIEHKVAPMFYDRAAGGDADGLPVRWLEMVRHTLETLGPQVLASRMVRDYVQQLYTPAANAGRGLARDARAARELATWKARVRAGWDGVRVDHVESAGVADTPEIGSTLALRAFVSLGALAPGDVDVQVVHGRVDADDQLAEAGVLSLRHVEAYEGGRHRFEGEVQLERTGAFGYTVRVLPLHALLANPAELGLVVNAEPVTEAAEVALR